MAAADTLLKAFHSKDGRRSMIPICPINRSGPRNTTHGPFTLNECLEGMSLLSRLGLVPDPVPASRGSSWTPAGHNRNHQPSEA